MVNGFCISRQGRRQRAFTLAELLIVIAIIAVLISVLLPSLAAARRSANTVKCLASLKNIGTAFQQYAQDNHRYFPVVRWYPATSVIAAGRPEWGVAGGAVSTTDGAGSNTTERNWVDFLSRYLIKASTNGNPNTYAQYQNTSVFWGCPSFNTDLFALTATDGRQNSMSYAMSPFAVGPYSNSVLPIGSGDATRMQAGIGATAYANLAYIATGGNPTYMVGDGGGRGQFFKMEQWGRHGQDKGLVTDSNGFDLVASAEWKKVLEYTAGAGGCGAEPTPMGMSYPLAAAPSFTGGYISVDSTRHLAPTSDRRKAFGQRGVNMLFVDGHATTITPREAWVATVGGGRDITN